MKKFRIVALLLILSLLLMPGAALAGEPVGLKYVALGDSIAYGHGATELSSYWPSYAIPPGMNGYTDMFNKHMTEIYGVGMYHNLSYPGVTSTMLRGALMTVAYDVYLDDVDVVTISIGGNDILAPVITLVGTIGVDQAYLVAATPREDWDTTLLSYVYSAALATETALTNNMGAFAGNWGDIIGAVYAKSDAAVIYVNNLYNPFLDDEVLYAFAEQFISPVNDIIENPIAIGIYGYQVVDVKGAFDEIGDKNNPLVHDLTDLTVALHPTNRGYKTISRLHKKLLQ